MANFQGRWVDDMSVPRAGYDEMAAFMGKSD